MLARIRRRLGAALFDHGLHGISRIGRLHPRARAAHENANIVRNIPYAPSGRTEHMLDVYRPHDALSSPRPTVFYIHGGAFRILSKDTHWVMALAFVRRGYVVFNVNYRLAPREPFPAALEDVCAAYGWVVRNAAKYGADPSRIVVAGESAGANLATALTLATCTRRAEPYAREVFDLGVVPRATIPACGMLQVTDPQRFHRRREALPAWLRDRLEETSDAYVGESARHGDPRLDLADPLVVLERDTPMERPLPPFFTFAGTKDPLLDDTRRLGVALDRRGVRCETRFYPGEVHAFHAMVWRPHARAAWGAMYSFLDEVL